MMKNRWKHKGRSMIYWSKIFVVFSVLLSIPILLIAGKGQTKAIAINADNYKPSQSLSLKNLLYVTSINNTLPMVEEVNSKSYEITKINLATTSIRAMLGINIADYSSYLSTQIPVLQIVDNRVAGVPNNNNSNNNPSRSGVRYIDFKNAIPPNLNEEDTGAIIEPVTNIPSNGNGSGKILIYHTHTTESYYGSGTNPRDPWFSTDSNVNVIAIGRELKKQLEKKGYTVIHDLTYHDIDGRDGSYNRSANTLRRNLIEHPDISFVFDIHRDGRPSETAAQIARAREEYSTTINGEKVTKIAVVWAKEAQNATANHSFMKIIENNMNTMYPGLFYKFYEKTYGMYNQHFINNSVLFEIGCNANTFDEAMASVKYLTEVLDQSVKQQQNQR
jgi:stage II sporulation protein P